MDTAQTTTPSAVLARAHARAAEFAPSADETAALTAAAAEMLDGDDTLEALDARRVFGEDSPIAHHCEAVAATFHVPATIPVLVALAFRGIGCADRVRQRIVPSAAAPWACPLHLWVFGELPAAVGKSSLLTKMGHGDILGFAEAAKRAWAGVAATDSHRRRRATRVVGNPKTSEAEGIEMEAYLESPRHSAPDMIADRTTVEDTRHTMLSAGFTCSILGEGREGLKRFVLDGVAVNDVNDGFSGSAVKADTRRDRERGSTAKFKEMHTALVWLPQPRGLAPSEPTARKNVNDAIGEHGFLARFLTARGEAGVVPSAQRYDAEVEAAYVADLAKFLDGIKHVAVGEGEPLPGLDRHPLAPRREHVTSVSVQQGFAGHWVDITGAAADCIYDFQEHHKRIARDLRVAAEARGQAKDPRSPTHGRIGELAMRIAAVLALIRVGGIAPLQRGEQVHVTLDEAKRAIYVCETLLPHAASMIREASMGEVAALVRRVVKTLAKEGKLTEARLWSSHAQHWPEVAGWDGKARASVFAALEAAERYGLVDKGRSPGGKATYDLSPAARRAVREVA